MPLLVFAGVAVGIGWFAEAGYWPLVALFVFLFFIQVPAELWKANTDKIALHEEALRPKLRIVFAIRMDEENSRPYLQILPYGGGWTDRRYRVGIQNMSAAAIHNVTVKLVRSEPPHEWIFPEHELAVQGANPPTGSCDVVPSKDDQLTAWFDVVFESIPPDGALNEFRFGYKDLNLRQPVAAGKYTITLRADGGDTSSTKQFIVEKLPGARLTMRAI